MFKETTRKEVFIFIHGFHHTFENAAFNMAEGWAS
ncbi:MAG: alpha/beta hydrolase [Planctomycetota bacterium]